MAIWRPKSSAGTRRDRNCRVMAGSVEQVATPDVNHVRTNMVGLSRAPEIRHRRRVRPPIAAELRSAIGDKERRGMRGGVIPGVLRLPHIPAERLRPYRPDDDLVMALHGDNAGLPVAADSVAQLVRGKPSGEPLDIRRGGRLRRRVPEAG